MGVLAAYFNLVPVTLLQGVIYAFVALAIMIPFRLLAFPDLTAEGSFPLGASVAAALIAAGADPIAAIFAAIGAGFLAGAATAAIHLALRLNTLLCGILVLTMLFSVNIRIMGKPNIPLFAFGDVFGEVLGAVGPQLWARIALVGGLVGAVGVLLLLFLKTEIGMAMRAVGASATMARAQGISVARYTLLGIGLAGALSAAGGAILAQNQSFADVNMGFGVLVNGLAAVIVGERISGRHTLVRQIAAPIVGAIVYFQVVSLALALGLQPSDLRLLTGLFVLIMLGVPALIGRLTGRSSETFAGDQR
jgi:putative tryptophan/tyrosine transport system permease protein